MVRLLIFVAACAAGGYGIHDGHPRMIVLGGVLAVIAIFGGGAGTQPPVWR